MPQPETLRVLIALELRRRGGRPRILPPKHVEAAMSRGQDPHLLRAIGRAWGWRQRLERGDVATLADLAADDGLSDRVREPPFAPHLARARGARAAGRPPRAEHDQHL